MFCTKLSLQNAFSLLQNQIKDCSECQSSGIIKIYIKIYYTRLVNIEVKLLNNTWVLIKITQFVQEWEELFLFWKWLDIGGGLG